MNLGNPIGQQHTVPSAGFDQGEHGAGIGLSGGHGHATSQNTQSGGTHTGSGSASGGLPTGTPIADKFTHQGQGTNSVAGAYAGGGTDDALTGQSNAHRTGAGVGPLGENLNPTGASAASGVQHGHQGHSHSHGQSASSIPAGVSGAYAGGNTRDALTGESHAQRTGAGVGPLGENLPAGHTATSAALAGTAAGAAAGAGVGSAYGTGVGPQGGSGGHYTVDSSSHSQGSQGQSLNQSHGTQGLGSSGAHTGAGAGGLASGTGAGGSQTLDAQRAGAQAHASGENVAAKLGLAGAGAGAGVGAGAAAAAGSGAASSTSSGGAGHYGTANTDSSRGEPVSDPKELDHGGRHGLVYQESTGKYVHRHEVDEGK